MRLQDPKEYPCRGFPSPLSRPRSNLERTAKSEISAAEPLLNPFVQRIVFIGTTVAEVAPNKAFNIDARSKG